MSHFLYIAGRPLTATLHCLSAASIVHDHSGPGAVWIQSELWTRCRGSPTFAGFECSVGLRTSGAIRGPQCIDLNRRKLGKIHSSLGALMRYYSLNV